MSIRNRVATAVVSLGALGIAGPVAASSAATFPVTVGANAVTPIVSTLNANLTTGQQSAKAAYAAGAQAAIGGWQAGYNGWLTGMQAARAGFAAGATALGLPVH
jgi:hypothetical protein